MAVVRNADGRAGMTEAEWAACQDPGPMLKVLHEKATDRKRRLFAVACCRRIWHLLTDQRSRNAVDAAELHADCPGKTDLAAAEHAAARVTTAIDEAWWQAGVDEIRGIGICVTFIERPVAFAAWAAECAAKTAVSARSVADKAACAVAWETGVESSEDSVFRAAYRTAAKEQCDLLRDVFGPLAFRPFAIDPSVLAWNDRLVMRIADAIYEKREWGEMPILADALLDAGCGDEKVLSHVRKEELHVKGCWVLDLLMGKA
jgi:hypothetical protein